MEYLLLALQGALQGAIKAATESLQYFFSGMLYAIGATIGFIATLSVLENLGR